MRKFRDRIFWQGTQWWLHSEKAMFTMYARLSDTSHLATLDWQQSSILLGVFWGILFTFGLSSVSPSFNRWSCRNRPGTMTEQSVLPTLQPWCNCGTSWHSTWRCSPEWRDIASGTGVTAWDVHVLRSVNTAPASGVWRSWDNLFILIILEVTWDFFQLVMEVSESWVTRRCPWHCAGAWSWGHPWQGCWGWTRGCVTTGIVNRSINIIWTVQSLGVISPGLPMSFRLIQARWISFWSWSWFISAEGGRCMTGRSTPLTSEAFFQHCQTAGLL